MRDKLKAYEQKSTIRSWPIAGIPPPNIEFLPHADDHLALIPDNFTLTNNKDTNVYLPINDSDINKDLSDFFAATLFIK